jgi:hypothetical protein
MVIMANLQLLTAREHHLHTARLLTVKGEKEGTIPPRIVSTFLLPVLISRTFLRLSCTSNPVANDEPSKAMSTKSALEYVSLTSILCAAS